MKTFLAIFVLLVIGAAAQEKAFPTPIMGKIVKGAPYSADEITETLQVLADGTRITHQSKASVYRDSEGRVRRESPDRITIFDAVTGFSYTLDPRTMTAEKLTMGTLVARGDKTVFRMRTAPAAGPESAEQSKAELDAQVAKLQAEMEAKKRALADHFAKSHTPVSELLGDQVIDGLNAKGTRSTEIIDTGEVGNDRPIYLVSETWVSTDLQTTILTKHNDPRTGEETFRLANIHRGDPPAYLFTVPPEYKEK